MYLDNGTTTTERFAYSSRFKLKPSTTYTLTGWFHNFTKCPSFDVFVLSSTSVDSSDTGTSYTNVHQLINAENTNGTWKKYTISFTTPAGCKSGVIRIDNNGYNSSGTNSNRIHWSALILSEGSLEFHGHHTQMKFMMVLLKLTKTVLKYLQVKGLILTLVQMV